MLSLLDLYNMREGKQPGSDLLEFYQGNGQAPEPQVIDRATFLPIGQYEDGSLTLAWPGFLKDAYEGAVRSYEQGRQLPRADEEGYYAGTPRAEPLDAFNAASVGPVSGVVGRAAGAIPRGALGSGGSDMLSGAKGIRAYHGSPHDFDKFDMSKINTGEGNQSYGRGLYFAENDSIARYYRDAVTDQHSYRAYTATDPMTAALQELRLAESAVKRFGSGNAKDYALQQLDLRIDELKRPRGLFRRQDPHSLSIAENLQQSRDLIAKGEAVIPEGHFYEVNINAEPDKFLDWSTLTPAEQARLKTKTGVDDARARGIPGVKYLDASSRIAGNGTHNYVVFDDSLVEIMRKYANPETASLPYLMTNALEQAASDAPKGIRAYHGSPHDFDRFSTAHIGRGEGNASYGNGLYFADSEDVAKSYRDSLAPDGGGRMYEVNINAQPEQFLDWTKSLDEQSPFVQDAVNRIAERLPPHQRPFARQAGKSTYSNLADAADIPSEHAASSLLREVGVPGIRYPDARSRAGGPGSYNYAVFDDSLIDIIRKYANPETASLPYLMTNGMEQAASDAPKGIRAYHGSPHDFDRFSLDKIGTGEGAQAFGHGLYFADSPAVADSYREGLSFGNGDTTITLGGKKLDRSDPLWETGLNTPPEQTIGQSLDYWKKQSEHWPDRFGHLIDAASAYPPDSTFRRGRMYEVNINAQPDHFINWDRPLAEQSEFVRNALKSDSISNLLRSAYKLEDLGNGDFAVKTPGGYWGASSREEAEKMIARAQANASIEHSLPPDENFVNVLAKYTGSPAAASEALQNAGIPGVRYLDQGSRATASGTHNYVVFDDSLVDIMRKYANPESASVPYLMTNGMEGDGAAYAELDPSTPPPYRLPGDVGESSDLMQILKDNNMLGNGQLPPRPPFRLWPEVTPEDQFWQQFHDEQLYKDMKREDIPPNFRPPLEVPDIDPVFPEDRWYRRIR